MISEMPGVKLDTRTNEFSADAAFAYCAHKTIPKLRIDSRFFRFLIPTLYIILTLLQVSAIIVSKFAYECQIDHIRSLS